MELAASRQSPLHTPPSPPSTWQGSGYHEGDSKDTTQGSSSWGFLGFNAAVANGTASRGWKEPARSYQVQVLKAVLGGLAASVSIGHCFQDWQPCGDLIKYNFIDSFYDH